MGIEGAVDAERVGVTAGLRLREHAGNSAVRRSALNRSGVMLLFNLEEVSRLSRPREPEFPPAPLVLSED